MKLNITLIGYLNIEISTKYVFEILFKTFVLILSKDLLTDISPTYRI